MRKNSFEFDPQRICQPSLRQRAWLYGLGGLVLMVAIICALTLSRSVQAQSPTPALSPPPSQPCPSGPAFQRFTQIEKDQKTTVTCLSYKDWDGYKKTAVLKDDNKFDIILEGGRWESRLISEEIKYQYWDKSEWSAKVKQSPTGTGREFDHTPKKVEGWRTQHKDTIIKYLGWNDEQVTASFTK